MTTWTIPKAACSSAVRSFGRSLRRNEDPMLFSVRERIFPMAVQANFMVHLAPTDPLEARPLVSIVICTRNRADHLAKTIKSLREQDFPKDQYEIVVVDNASSDNTPNLVEGLASSSDTLIRYIHEARLGVSYARNSGMSAARGVFTAYIDDDEEAAPSWLQGVLDGFSVVPEPGIVCGPVHPAWEIHPPKWMSDEIEVYYSIFLPTQRASFVENLTWFPEGNSAFRTDLLRSIDGFATNMGRRGDLLLSGECARVEKSLRALGYGVYYQPSMSVRHFIPASRMTLKWLSKRCYFQGITDAIHHLEGRRYGPLSMLKLLTLYAYNLARATSLVAINWCQYRFSSPRRVGLIDYVQSRAQFFAKLGWLNGFALQSFGRLNE